MAHDPQSTTSTLANPALSMLDSHRTSVAAALLLATLPPATAQGGPPILREDQLLQRPTTTHEDHLGHGLAISGPFMIAGAPGHDQVAVDAGSADVFEEVGGSWIHRQSLFGSQTGTGSGFGNSVDIDGDLAIVGADSDDWSGFDTGSAYIFRRVGGAWVEVAYLTAFDGHQAQLYGHEVAISGDTAIVTAPQDDELVPNSGAVYVYREVGGAWTFEQKLKVSNPMTWSSIGHAVDLDGDRIVVGDTSWRGPGNSLAGAVWVFERQGAVWTEVDLITGTDTTTTRMLGYAVALEGDRLAATTSHDPPSNGGTLRIFDHDGSTWSETQKLGPQPTPVGQSRFYGRSVDLHGDAIVVGAHFEAAPQLPYAGAAYIYQRTPTGWAERGRFVPTTVAEEHYFGSDVAVDGPWVAGSSPRVRITAPEQGIVYTHELADPPEVYCTPKVHSAGCAPAISSLGFPSVTASFEFELIAHEVLNRKSGILFYGSNPSALPFQGGTLCVATPTQRTPPSSSGGNPGAPDCSGSLSYDFLPLIQSGTQPALAEGAVVYAQFWFRDPGDAFGTGLSDGIRFTVGP